MSESRKSTSATITQRLTYGSGYLSYLVLSNLLETAEATTYHHHRYYHHPHHDNGDYSDYSGSYSYPVTTPSNSDEDGSPWWVWPLVVTIIVSAGYGTRRLIRWAQENEAKDARGAYTTVAQQPQSTLELTTSPPDSKQTDEEAPSTSVPEPSEDEMTEIDPDAPPPPETPLSQCKAILSAGWVALKTDVGDRANQLSDWLAEKSRSFRS